MKGNQVSVYFTRHQLLAGHLSINNQKGDGGEADRKTVGFRDGKIMNSRDGQINKGTDR